MNKEIGATEGGRDWGAIIPSFLDDYGLDPYEMRVYIRLARRAGMGGQCWESVTNMAHACFMSPQKVKNCLALLTAANSIKLSKRPGASNLYELMPERHWVKASSLDQLRSRVTAYRTVSDQKRHKLYQQQVAAKPSKNVVSYLVANSDVADYEVANYDVATTQLPRSYPPDYDVATTQLRGSHPPSYEVATKESLLSIPFKDSHEGIPLTPLTPQSDECEGDNLPAEKTGGGSPAHLPEYRIDQLELLEKKNCHDSQFSAATEKLDGRQPDFSASLLAQSELTEKQNNSGEDFNSAAESPRSCFEVPAIQPHASFFKQPVVAALGQPNVSEGRKLRERSATQTPSMNPGALDQTSGYVLALSPEAPSASSAPPALFGQEYSTAARSQDESRYQRTQPHLPKNLDSSDRLPWDTEKRGVFDPKFENWMARSLMQYPAYRDLMAGELMTKVRKHISAGRYDLKRRDELLIEWEAFQTQAEMGVVSSGLTAKGAARRVKTARALGMEVC